MSTTGAPGVSLVGPTGIIGIDEVGRGCWAGPVVAGAVWLEQDVVGLRDSKKLSAMQRARLVPEITVSSRAYGLGWVTAVELDTIGLTAAVQLAMRRALTVCREMLPPGAVTGQIIIDGDYNYLPEEPSAVTLVKADDLVPAVSAASILAKVARDNFMTTQDKLFPGYGFAKHVGYGTAAHQAALLSNGVCELHRLSFKPIAKIAKAV